MSSIYAREHWVRPGENAPVGLIVCADHGGGVAKYALSDVPSKFLAARSLGTIHRVGNTRR